MSTIEPTSLNDSPGLLLLYLRECSLWPGSGGAIIPEGAVAGVLCGLEVVLLPGLLHQSLTLLLLILDVKS